MSKSTAGNSFQRGDIVWVDFDPSVGTELQKRRPALVVSSANYHQVFPKQIQIVPITSGGVAARIAGFTVALDARTTTTGVVRCDAGQTFDPVARRAVFAERAPDDVVEEVIDILASLLD